jgi:hypothetical protein
MQIGKVETGMIRHAEQEVEDLCRFFWFSQDCMFRRAQIGIVGRWILCLGDRRYRANGR